MNFLIHEILPEAAFVHERIYPMCEKWRYKNYLICTDCGYIINETTNEHISFIGTVIQRKEILKLIK